MEKRIQLEKRGRLANQIAELNLDNCRSTNIVGLTDEFTALESLSLINVGLTTLKGFPKLPNLKKLELSDNRISNGLNHLEGSPKLTNLNLSGNKIRDLETLKPLESFQNLEVLDLFNNEATTVENYRDQIFGMIPSLKYLDGFDANEVEASSDGDDDEEANGNDSEDDAASAFCINGLEIDLDELEKFEKHLVDKKGVPKQQNEFEVDDLDEYLEKLKLKECEVGGSTKDEAEEASSISTTISTVLNSSEQLAENKINEYVSQGQPVSFPLLMYGFLAILSLISYTFRSDEGEDEDDGDDDDDDDDSDEEDNGDISLAEVYNDELEEDNSDWGGEENEAEEEDDDADSNSEPEEGEEVQVPSAAAVPEDPQARGKKRKHDG